MRGNSTAMNAGSTVELNNQIYERSLLKQPSSLSRILSSAWTVFLVFSLIAFALLPFSNRFFGGLLAARGYPAWWVTLPLIVLRAITAVTVIGYANHRFVEHVGWMTRIDDHVRPFLGQTIARGLGEYVRDAQRDHKIHHWWQYPFGELLVRNVKYVGAVQGFSWEWYIPGFIVGAAFIALNGLNWGTALFVATVYVYAQWVVSVVHHRFHEDVATSHPRWARSRYFQWLFKLHILHHYDEDHNHDIVLPIMDFLTGRLLWPRFHVQEIQGLRDEKIICISQIRNWRYVLLYATPAERASFVTDATRPGRTPATIQMLRNLLSLLEDRLTLHPDDAQAQLLKQRAECVLTELASAAQAA